jgi:hypothetical protein
VPGRSKPAVARYLFAVLPVLALTAPSAFASERWPDERALGPVTFHADYSLADFERLLADTARLKRDLTATLGIRPAEEPIHVYLFARQATYRAYMTRYFPKVPYRRALFIKGTGPGMVFAYRSNELDVDVRHESTHAFLHAALPMVPLWLDEGLAEYFETTPDDRAHGSPHLAAVKLNARLGLAPSLAKLEKVADPAQMGRGEYRDAWAWAHFMLHGPPEAKDELTRFLGDIQARTPPGSLSARLRRRLGDPERLFVEHFRGW